MWLQCTFIQTGNLRNEIIEGIFFNNKEFESSSLYNKGYNNYSYYKYKKTKNNEIRFKKKTKNKLRIIHKTIKHKLNVFNSLYGSIYDIDEILNRITSNKVLEYVLELYKKDNYNGQINEDVPHFDFRRILNISLDGDTKYYNMFMKYLYRRNSNSYM